MTKSCSVQQCKNKHLARGFCGVHYNRLVRSGSIESKRRPKGQGTIHDGYVRHIMGRVLIYEHIIIVEKVLLRKLGLNEVVHHIDGNTTNNTHSNLLVCNKEYHALLHARMRAFNACGDPNKRRC